MSVKTEENARVTLERSVDLLVVQQLVDLTPEATEGAASQVFDLLCLCAELGKLSQVLDVSVETKRPALPRLQPD